MKEERTRGRDWTGTCVFGTAPPMDFGVGLINGVTEWGIIDEGD